MADRVPLAQMPVGSTFALTGRLVSRSAAGLRVEFIRPDGATVGTLNIAPDGTFTGALTIAPADAQVEPLAVAMDVGDVMRSERTGERVVVMATGLGPDGRGWSYSPNRRPMLTPEGWTKVSHVNPDSL